ncbi:MAG: GNAT family N-acetyltransferase [Chitinophagales bacterium]|nr:GNAT family N-acetyltransferase [Chitinophagales bacterium]
MDDIKTDRLLLCHLTTADAPFIFELLNTPGWLQFIGDRGIKSEEDAINYILNGPVKSYAENGFGLMLVKLKDDGTPLGICGLIRRPALDDVDIGFAFLERHTGKGYAAEAASATLNYGWQVLGLKRIVAITTADNLHSIRLLEKTGMHFEKKMFMVGDAEELLLFAIP